MGQRITIIGDGGWGTALALVLDRNGHDVCVWGHERSHIETVRKNGVNAKYLPGIRMPESIAWTSDVAMASTAVDGFVVAVPSRFYEATLAFFRGHVPVSSPVISVSKGLLRGLRLSEVAREALSLDNISALSGPSHAEEVAQGVPAAVTVASSSLDQALWWQQQFNNRCFRVYRSDDLVGVEMGGALKNVIAIAAGICDGIGYGDNAKAALITRGLAEMTRLGVASGAKASTFSGLSGIGDLIVTATSRHSRNRGVGERLGKGERIADILSGMAMEAEGVHNCRAACEWAEAHGVSAPIAEAVMRVVHEGWSARDAVTDLLAREPGEE